jgi:cytochrome c peroxidase
MRSIVLAALLLAATNLSAPRLPGVEPMKVPADNPLTPQKIALGRQLFNDPRLSGDGATSCSGCHEPKYGFTIGAAKPVGAFKVEQNRACPSLINVGYQKAFYWEGSAPTLERAIDGVWKFIVAPKGEGRPSIDEIVAKLNADKALQAKFVAAFGSEAKPELVIKALASYLRTLVPTKAAWVRYWNGEESALSERARKGYEIFDGKARCSICHSGVLLTDRLYHAIGAGQGTGDVKGRGGKDPRDMGAYKTPTLLNIARSAPYFHDNSVPTLEAAVDRMLAGGFPSDHIDPQLRAVQLTPEERDLLLAFFRELNADPGT